FWACIPLCRPLRDANLSLLRKKSEEGRISSEAIFQQPASGEVAKSTDGGKTFTKITTGLTRLGVEVHLDPESPNVLYVSQSRIIGVDTFSGSLQPAGVFVSTNSGAIWTLNKVDPTLQRPNDQIYSLVALTIKNPPPGVVAVPVITSLAPSSTTAGGPDFTLAVIGAGFLSGAAMQWNGSPLSTT